LYVRARSGGCYDWRHNREFKESCRVFVRFCALIDSCIWLLGLLSVLN
jgi:hypothetical protein